MSSRRSSPHRRDRRRRRARRRVLVACAIVAVTVALAGAVGWTVHTAIQGQSSTRYEEALMRFEAGDHKAAVVILENLLHHDGDNLPSLVLVGRAYLRLGYAEKAEQALRQARQAGAHPSLVSVPLAKAYLQQGKYRQLVDELPATERDPSLRGHMLVMHGQAHLELREFDRAERAFEQAMDLLPGWTGALLGRAQVLLRNGRLDDAERLAQEAGALAPDSAQAWYVKGEVLRARRDTAGAVESYGAAVERDPGHLAARLARAALLVWADRDADALEDVRAVWAVRPDDPQANYQYAIILTKQGETGEAQAFVERAALGLMSHRTDFVMHHPPGLLLLGLLHFRNDSFDQAYSLLERYVTLEPGHPGASKLLAVVALLRELPRTALEALTPAAEVAPGDPELLVLMAQAHGLVGRHDEAALLLGQALEGDPQTAGAASRRAFMQLVLQEREVTSAELADGLEFVASDSGVGRLLSLLHQQGVSPGALLETARVLARQQPDSAPVANLLGAAALAAEEPEEARAALDRALELDPELVVATRNLARAEARSGDLDGARRRLEARLERDPDDARARKALAELDVLHRAPDEATVRAVTARAADPGVVIDARGARETLEQMLERDPGFLPAYESLVELHLRMAHPEAALAVAAKLRERRPGKVLGDRLYADVLAYMGRHAEAVGIYREALARSDTPELVVSLFRARAALGELDEAVEELATWNAAHPGHTAVRRALAGGHLQAGQPERALPIYESLLAASPDDALLLSSVARLYVGRGDPRSLDLAQRAHALDAGHPDILDTLGWVLVNQGEVDEGLGYLRDAQNRAGREPRIHYHVAAALSRLGRTEEARRELRRALGEGGHFEGEPEARRLLAELGG